VGQGVSLFHVKKKWGIKRRDKENTVSDKMGRRAAVEKVGEGQSSEGSCQQKMSTRPKKAKVSKECMPITESQKGGSKRTFNITATAESCCSSIKEKLTHPIYRGTSTPFGLATQREEAVK